MGHYNKPSIAEKDWTLEVSGLVKHPMRFTLQASSNLVSWVSLVTNTSASGSFDFTDTRSTNAPRRFYRALMLP